MFLDTWLRIIIGKRLGQTYSSEQLKYWPTSPEEICYGSLSVKKTKKPMLFKQKYYINCYEVKWRMKTVQAMKCPMSFSKKFAQIFVSTFTILNVRVSPWEKILAQQTLSTGQTKFHRSLSLEGFYLCFFCIAIKYCQHSFEKVIVLKPELIYVTNITNYIHGEKIVMWRNFSFP